MERDPADAIAFMLKQEREARKWSLADLAQRSGVSKAMISKIERREASPTATVLGRLSGAFGVPLSVLIASAEKAAERLSLSERHRSGRIPRRVISEERFRPPVRRQS